MKLAYVDTSCLVAIAFGEPLISMQVWPGELVLAEGSVSPITPPLLYDVTRDQLWMLDYVRRVADYTGDEVSIVASP